MSQILHIFRKDARHHWIEILLCQGALVAYCWNEVRSWNERFSVGLNTLSTVIDVLLPLTWGFFVFRIVHSESLVGDRQFWVTRPYEWKKLLAEKVLMVLAFINLPLLIAGAVLLIKAGFSPAPHIAGLLWMQLLVFHLPFLPLLALAAVTRNLAQGLLALLPVALFMAGMLFLDSLLRDAGLSPGDTDWLEGGALGVVCLAAIGLQYARRKTTQSRVWLAGGVFAMVIIELTSAYAGRNTNPYPMPAGAASFHADLQPIKLSAPKNPPEKDEDISLGMPIRAWGLPSSSLGRVRGIKLTLQAPDGFLWDSGWQGYYGLFGPSEHQWQQEFSMKYKTYERLRSVPLKARVSVAVEVLRERDFETIRAAGGDFDVPRVGRCRVREKDAENLRCHAPLMKPHMVVVRVNPASSTCPTENDWRDKLEGIPYSWEAGRDSNLPEYGVSPVSSFGFYLGRLLICPGTPLNFSFPEFVENTRSDFEFNVANLDEYRRPGLLYSDHVVWGIGTR